MLLLFVKLGRNRINYAILNKKNMIHDESGL